MWSTMIFLDLWQLVKLVDDIQFFSSEPYRQTENGSKTELKFNHNTPSCFPKVEES